jgi:rifampicin phosphotransferase
MISHTSGLGTRGSGLGGRGPGTRKGLNARASIAEPRGPSPEPRVSGVFVIALDDAHDLREVGAKAHNLARLIQISQPVPAGFVVTDAALTYFLAEHDLDPLIGTLCSKLDVRSPLGVRAAAETVSGLMRACVLPADIAADLDASGVAFLDDTLIVRSSAVGEDSREDSFAGQLDSIPDVTGAGLLRHALVDVWSSRWSQRALTYQLARGVSLKGMGVIVQRQIAASISGVLFTVSPENETDMLVEYCAGAGEALVAGRENPGRLTIARHDLRWAHQASPDRRLPEADAATLFDDRWIAALARRALDIEREFGAPQDIEWTMDADGRLWIVQTRPITTVCNKSTVANRQSTGRNRPSTKLRATVSLSNGPQPAIRNPQSISWSNANVNENFPQPISPLLYSIASTGYYHYFRNLGRAFGISKRRLAACEQPLRHIIGVHGARMYYNLTSIHGVLRSAPFGEWLAASFNQFVGAEDTASPAFAPGRRRFQRRRKPDPTDPVGLLDVTGLIRQACELAVIAAKTTWQYLFLTRRVERFERTADAFARRTHPDGLVNRTSQDLLGDLRGFLDIRNHRWNDAALADAASMVCYGVLQRSLSRAFPSDAALHNNLLKALPNLVSSMPALKLWELSRLVRRDRALLDLLGTRSSKEVIETIRSDRTFESFRTELDRFLEDWGFRCSGELMLTVPSFQEEPHRLIELLKAYVALDGDSPANQLRIQESERLRETTRVLALLGSRVHKRLALSLLLRWTQTSITLRERARLKQALLYSRLRRLALAIGRRLTDDGRLERAEDIFFLTADEIDALLSGSAMFPDHVRPLIAVRRQAHAEVASLSPPDSMTLEAGAYVTGLGARDSAFDKLRPTLSRVEGSGLGERLRPARGAESSAFSKATARPRRSSKSVGGPSASEWGWGPTSIEKRYSEPPGSELHGLGVCGGTATSRAAVLTDISQAHLLQPGDVLVTRQTDPGWAAVFPLISGLVMERGGMLSHGSIIAREFGIPSVVGVANATRLIPPGRVVHIDGERGTVRIEPPGGPA